MDSSFGERVDECVRIMGSRKALAESARISTRALDQYRSGDTDPTRRKLIAMARAAGVNVEWLATGEGPKLREGGMPASSEPGRHIFQVVQPQAVYEVRPAIDLAVEVALPVFDSRLITTPDRFGQLEFVSEYLMVSQSYLRDTLWLDPRTATGLYVYRDHMEPTIHHGSLVVLEAGMRNVEYDGIYVLMKGELPIVRRAKLLGDGSLQMSCDNPKYTASDLVVLSPAELQEWDVLGRVGGVISRLE